MEDCSFVVMGWIVDDPGTSSGSLSPERMGTLEEAMRHFATEHEGWVALAHGTEPTLEALSVRVGVLVASCPVSELATGLADEGNFDNGDEDFLEHVEFDDASVKATKKLFASGKAGVLSLLERLGLHVYDSKKPAHWLLVTGGQTRGVLVDVDGKRSHVSAEGEPRRLKLARGTHRLTSF